MANNPSKRIWIIIFFLLSALFGSIVETWSSSLEVSLWAHFSTSRDNECFLHFLWKSIFKPHFMWLNKLRLADVKRCQSSDPFIILILITKIISNFSKKPKKLLKNTPSTQKSIKYASYQLLSEFWPLMNFNTVISKFSKTQKITQKDLLNWPLMNFNTDYKNDFEIKNLKNTQKCQLADKMRHETIGRHNI